MHSLSGLQTKSNCRKRWQLYICNQVCSCMVLADIILRMKTTTMRSSKSGERYGERQNSKAFGGIILKTYTAQEPLEFRVWHGDRANWWQHLPLFRVSPRVSQTMV